MPRTGPDWSSYGRLERMLAQYDIAELSARITNYMTPHREGQWLFRDGFEGGVNNWVHSSPGTGGDTGLTCEFFRVGGGAMLLKTGNDTGDSALMTKGFPFPNTGHCGFEFAWAGNGVDMKVELTVRLYYERRLRRFGVIMDLENDKLQSMLYDDTWQDWVEDVYVYNDEDSWNVCKLVVDFDGGAYERFLLNGVEYEITTYQTSVSGVIDARLSQMEMEVETREGDNAIIYVDEVIVTENERGW